MERDRDQFCEYRCVLSSCGKTHHAFPALSGFLAHLGTQYIFGDEHIHSRHQSDELKAISVAFGVFMGIIPIWGFQLVTAIFLAILFRLNKAIVIVAANISIPPMIPLIIFLSYKMGHFALGEKAVDMAFTADITLDSIKLHGEQYIVGSILLAFVAAAVFGILSYLLIKIFKRSTHLAG